MAYKSTVIKTKKGKATKKTVTKPKKKTPNKSMDTLKIVVTKKK